MPCFQLPAANQSPVAIEVTANAVYQGRGTPDYGQDQQLTGLLLFPSASTDAGHRCGPNTGGLQSAMLKEHMSCCYDCRHEMTVDLIGDCRSAALLALGSLRRPCERG